MRAWILGLIVLASLGTPAFAEEAAKEFTITLRNQKFEPSELTLPAGEKVKLIIKNESDSAAEFESEELRREKVVAAHGTASFFVGPLTAGNYPFVDDFHEDTTKGTITVK